jgi:DNA-binding NarL/FixJ family response regulator
MERFILYGALTIAGYFVVYLVLKAKLNKSVDPKAILEAIREEVDRIIVELNSTTDRNITLLEDKVQSLNTLLEQADKKIGILKREIEKHELSAKVYSELANSRKEVQKGEEQDRHTQVLNLHRQGMSKAAIAKRLGITLAEIELIITLASRMNAGQREQGG